MAFSARYCCVLLILATCTTVVENESTITLYHYTSKTGIDAITSSGYMRQSTGNTALFGDGVYLTSLDPWTNSRTDIAKNNWDGIAANAVSQGKTDYLIQIKIGLSVVEEVTSTPRNIYIYKGELYLKDTTQWSTFHWSRETGEVTLIHSSVSAGVKAELNPLLSIITMISIVKWFTLY